jgi:hypothetical protein
MILAAHQPNYLPWCGYFYKLAHCDVFVILDDVQYTKRSWQNRTRIKGSQGPLWLTQPVLQSGRAWQPTDTVEFNNDVDWRTKHLKSLALNYARTPHTEAILTACRRWFGGDSSTRLVETNTRLIREVAGLLNLRAEIVLSSALAVQQTKADRLVEICRRLGADTYLSGQGARAYQEDELFRAAGIDLVYSDFVPRTYPQLWGEFCPGLSVLDALFNLGADATAEMLAHDEVSEPAH